MILQSPWRLQGKKHRSLEWLVPLLPSGERYIEPFMGSGVVALNVNPERAILADKQWLFPTFFAGVQQGELTSRYIEQLFSFWHEKEPGDGTFFHECRKIFNETDEYSPERTVLGLFLNRLSFSSIFRLNKYGKFNSSFGAKLSKKLLWNQYEVIQQMELFLSRKKWKYVCQNYTETIAMGEKGDVIYCDPPYIGLWSGYGKWTKKDERTLQTKLLQCPCSVALSTWFEKNVNGELVENSFIEEYISSGFTVLKQETRYNRLSKGKLNEILLIRQA